MERFASLTFWILLGVITTGAGCIIRAGTADDAASFAAKAVGEVLFEVGTTMIVLVVAYHFWVRASARKD